MSDVTVGIDIGTSSVKALAVDADGSVVASARVPHEYRVPSPGRLEHDAAVAWRDGPIAALAALGVDGVRGVSVSAMVPSLTAVDATGTPVLPGLLYGDERGRAGKAAGAGATGLEFDGFVRWLTSEAPDARGLWPAQAVANHALSGEAVIDSVTAMTAQPVFNFTEWDAEIAAQLGARVDQFPPIAPTGSAAGTVLGTDAVLAPGCIDAMAEQLVAGADQRGDVLVLLGTTLIVWVVAEEFGDVPGYTIIPHTTAGMALVGGPSNAGGLFCDWVGRLLGGRDRDAGGPQPDRVPVWAPYPRGERSPINDPDRRATLADLDLTHDAAAVRRAAYEASGFVVRRAIDATRAALRATPERIVASGGGVRVDAWLQAIADATALPVECVAVPEGAALGSAWLARMAAGLEGPTAMPEARRWARRGHTVEPRREWVEPVAARYARFLELSDAVT
ncbi:MAG TPA: FGGY-family carbohydrate kinase [Acidimicrobiia bacterium]|nr:FGGY-family carbohydrate kinase [Acidimicrobiia bacterium]